MSFSLISYFVRPNDPIPWLLIWSNGWKVSSFVLWCSMHVKVESQAFVCVCVHLGFVTNPNLSIIKCWIWFTNYLFYIIRNPWTFEIDIWIKFRSCQTALGYRNRVKYANIPMQIRRYHTREGAIKLFEIEVVPCFIN